MYVYLSESLQSSSVELLSLQTNDAIKTVQEILGKCKYLKWFHSRYMLINSANNIKFKYSVVFAGSFYKAS